MGEAGGEGGVEEGEGEVEGEGGRRDGDVVSADHHGRAAFVGGEEGGVGGVSISGVGRSCTAGVGGSSISGVGGSSISGSKVGIEQMLVRRRIVTNSAQARCVHRLRLDTSHKPLNPQPLNPQPLNHSNTQTLYPKP